LFDVNNNELSETHDTPFMHGIKDGWSGKEAVFYNLVLLLYLFQARQTLLQSLRVNGVEELTRFYDQKPELEDVSDFLDGSYYQDGTQFLEALQNVYRHNVHYKPYVHVLLKEPDFQVLKKNLFIFARSLEPGRLPRVFAPSGSVWYMYPTCVKKRVDSGTMLWSNMFEEKKECEVYLRKPKVPLKTSQVLLRKWYSVLSQYFDGFEVEPGIIGPLNDEWADRVQRIIGVFRITQNDTAFTFSFDTYRGSEARVSENQHQAPWFFVYQNGVVTRLLPKVPLTESVAMYWNGKTVDVNGFPVVPTTQELLNREPVQWAYQVKVQTLKTLNDDYLLNWYFGGGSDYKIQLSYKLNVTYLVNMPPNYLEFLYNFLYLPFLPITFNNVPETNSIIRHLFELLTDKLDAVLDVFH
jgi:hypothetical protein